MNYRVLANGAAHLLSKRTVSLFRQKQHWLRGTEFMGRGELARLQLTLLKQLLCHCYATVPYYRRVMGAEGIRPEDIRSFSDYQRMPVLTKAAVLEAGGSIVSRKYPRWSLRKAYTGGTTGTPLQVYRDYFSIGIEHAFVRRQYRWAGLGTRDRVAVLTGRVICDPNREDGRLYVYEPFMRELVLSTYHLSAARVESYLEAMRRYGVSALAGYPSAVHLFARGCLDRGIAVPLKAVLTSSETLSPTMRETISRVFKCKVYDFYGSAERVCYIFTCEEGRYHIQPEYGYAELMPVEGAAPGTCKMVATGFWNRAMPLLRYDMGDVVIASSESACSCGRHFSMVQAIQGRQAVTIRTPSGRELGAAVLTHLLYGTGNILESQIVQDRLDNITIRYVPGKAFTALNLEQLRQLVKMHLTEEVTVSLEAVDQLEKTRSGKLEPLISLLPKEQGALCVT